MLRPKFKLPLPQLSPARLQLAAAIAAQHVRPDPERRALEQDVTDAQAEEVRESMVFEACRQPSPGFDIEARHRAEQAWTRAAALLETARAALAEYKIAHDPTPAMSLAKAEARTAAVLAVIADEGSRLAERLKSEMASASRLDCALTAIHQHLLAQGRTTGNTAAMRAAEHVQIAINAARGAHRVDFGLALQQQKRVQAWQDAVNADPADELTDYIQGV
jgi:hypothetical protein